MPDVIVIGGGLAGLAAAAALGTAGYGVQLLEARGFLGGRATSYPLSQSDGDTATIDNCQHILLRCCVNLLDFYERLNAREHIRFHREFFFLEPGGRMSTLKAGIFPAPAHFAGSFFHLRFLSTADKIAVGRAIAALRSEWSSRQDLDRITMLQWLEEKRQTPRAIQRFWRQVLVSAINEDLDRMAALHGFQVFHLGFLARADSYQMGIPAVPLGELYGVEAWKRFDSVRIVLRSAVERIVIDNSTVREVTVAGASRRADFYVCCLPFERVPTVAPDLPLDLSSFSHSPITGIHLWFDRPVTDLPHATLLDRTIQWMFNKDRGRYVQVVVSASRSLVEMSRADVIELATRELAEFFPAVRKARLEKAHVVKELRATFSAAPGLEQKRPASVTPVKNLFLGGDWTRSGWPATMEGAVRSGYLAAEAVTAAAGAPQRFLLNNL
ncbi:MAG TPA: hydroxysqualene dehydroxylase HpnE [Bryobacteraceae bacterium]|nr:hydroxysqualene dehydroxylase HpnE [Bryobacteraceae bacterium]